ncbi:MAG TPA: hypothetical protein VFB14_24080 [Bryobacteraceae bacterium]|jgi:hypothetical protein|nr:hypothetical protein [Bryobacteraceae bacterium]
MAYDETKDERLKKLLEKRKAIDAKRRALDARINAIQNQQTQRDKKLEDRRMIIAGKAMALWARRSNANAAIYHAEIDAFCTRNIDRELFGLKKLPEKEKA